MVYINAEISYLVKWMGTRRNFDLQPLLKFLEGHQSSGIEVRSYESIYISNDGIDRGCGKRTFVGFGVNGIDDVIADIYRDKGREFMLNNHLNNNIFDATDLETGESFLVYKDDNGKFILCESKEDYEPIKNKIILDNINDTILYEVVRDEVFNGVE